MQRVGGADTKAPEDLSGFLIKLTAFHNSNRAINSVKFLFAVYPDRLAPSALGILRRFSFQFVSLKLVNYYKTPLSEPEPVLIHGYSSQSYRRIGTTMRRTTSFNAKYRNHR